MNRRLFHSKWWRSVKKPAKKGQNTSFYNVFSPFTTRFSCTTKNWDQMCIASDRPCYSASINLVLCPTSAYSRSSLKKNVPKHVFSVLGRFLGHNFRNIWSYGIKIISPNSPMYSSLNKNSFMC